MAAGGRTSQLVAVLPRTLDNAGRQAG
eukprot:SAG31_NODE_44354_length_263_cov_0.628049_1_plen_26_part_01